MDSGVSLLCISVLVISASQISAYYRESASVVIVRSENSPDLRRSAQAEIDCSALGPWNITLNITVVTIQEQQALGMYQSVLQLQQRPEQYIFLDSPVAESPVLDAALEVGRGRFNPHSFLVLKEEENRPFVWCCHVARNASMTSDPAGSRDSSQLDFYNSINREYNLSRPDDTSCPSASRLAATELHNWREAKERQAKVMLDIVTGLKWDTFLILFESRFEQQVRLLVQLASNAKVKVQVAGVEDAETAQNIMLRYFDTSPDLNVVVITSVDVAQEVFQLVGWDMCKQQVRLLVQLASNAKVKVQVAGVEDAETAQNIMLRYFDTSPDLNVVVITSVDVAQEVFQLAQGLEPKIGKRISVTGLSRWLLFCQEGTVLPHTWMFSSIFDNIALVSDPHQLGPGHQVEIGKDNLFTLTTLLYKTGRRELATVGSVHYDWTLDLQQDVFPNIKFGFNGRLFVVTTLSWTPYVYRHVKEDGNVTFSGFCMDMADELSRTMNFTIQWTEPPDGYWGIDEGNGSWNGLVGQVAKQEVDMVIAPIGITEAREGVIDFTSPFFYDDSAVILKKPDPNAAKWRTYIDIFRQEVLVCVMAALLGGFAVLSLLVWAEMYVYGRTQKVFANSYFGSFLYLYGAMLAQGGRNLPKSAAGRVFLSSWWLFCIVVAGTYSGNLIAVLTVTKDKPPFNTLKEMAAQDEYRFGTLGNSMWTELFKTSPRPEFQAISKKMEDYFRDDPDTYHTSTAVQLEKVKRGGYAYIADKGLFSSWLATNCDLILLKEKFFPGRYGIVLPNHSVYTKVFSDQVVKFYESGLLQVWVKKWWPQQTFCRGSLVTQARALSLVDVQSSFYVLAIGVAMSLVVLMFEHAFILSNQLWLRVSGERSGTNVVVTPGAVEDKTPSGTKPKSGLRLRRF
ncbi:glutamate receptor [Plakobranchus ocellatus]|uniref:Glutamate receptor n=1 Tax=Plakobranchus ocellatus TaxID=259542 RepID=A0AAV4DZK2_9GAST|nr:glutamate receptor [Plakobranchus ocellatus]